MLSDCSRAARLVSGWALEAMDMAKGQTTSNDSRETKNLRRRAMVMRATSSWQGREA